MAWASPDQLDNATDLYRIFLTPLRVGYRSRRHQKKSSQGDNFGAAFRKPVYLSVIDCHLLVSSFKNSGSPEPGQSSMFPFAPGSQILIPRTILMLLSPFPGGRLNRHSPASRILTTMVPRFGRCDNTFRTRAGSLVDFRPCLFDPRAQMAGFGASRPLPCVPAEVSCLIT